jgi:universal stress protein A
VVLELESKDERLLTPLPFQLRRILVPMDFSDVAKKALRYAVPFAVAFDAEVVLVHVLQPFSVSFEAGFMGPEMAGSMEEFKSAAQEALAKLSAHEIGTRARTQAQVREGVAWHEIITAARETDTDLIILATHGRTGLPHVVLGSVAERVVQHAPCPVLVVRETERDFAP